MKDFKLIFDRNTGDLNIICDDEVLIIDGFIQTGDEYSCTLKPIGQIKLLKKITNNL
jgi:hypothetical protein